MTGIESDLSALTVPQLRALAEACRARAQTEIVTTLEPIIQLAIVVMELARRGEQAALGPMPLLEGARFKWHISAARPVPVYTAPDVKRPALRMQKPRLDTEFDVVGMRGDGWLLVYRNVVDGLGKLEYWVRVADGLAGGVGVGAAPPRGPGGRGRSGAGHFADAPGAGRNDAGACRCVESFYLAHEFYDCLQAAHIVNSRRVRGIAISPPGRIIGHLTELVSGFVGQAIPDHPSIFHPGFREVNEFIFSFHVCYSSVPPTPRSPPVPRRARRLPLVTPSHSSPAPPRP